MSKENLAKQASETLGLPYVHNFSWLNYDQLSVPLSVHRSPDTPSTGWQRYYAQISVEHGGQRFVQLLPLSDLPNAIDEIFTDQTVKTSNITDFTPEERLAYIRKIYNRSLRKRRFMLSSSQSHLAISDSPQWQIARTLFQPTTCLLGPTYYYSYGRSNIKLWEFIGNLSIYAPQAEVHQRGWKISNVRRTVPNPQAQIGSLEFSSDYHISI